MRGLAQGEVSSTSRPIIQLFCRSGGYLADLTEGWFRIDFLGFSGQEDVTIKVSQTSFDLVADKVGTGRYAISTGATTTWKVGSYRAVCSYKLEVGGPDYIQSIPFEVLDPADWPTGQQYRGYISTQQAYRQDYLDFSKTSTQRAHQLINRIARQIEAWTHQFFEPRYLEIKVSGQNSPILLLDNPVIALEDAFAVWKTSTGETTYKYEQYLYKVYNRHLDGYTADDDRRHPRIELTDVDGDVVKVSDFSWPYGNQNILLKGVFGYTDPDFDPMAGQTGVGYTPPDLGVVVGTLASRQVADPTMEDLTTQQPGSIKSYRTRDQSISFHGSGGSSSSGGGGGTGAGDLSGDPLLDAILGRYAAPVSLVGV